MSRIAAIDWEWETRSLMGIADIYKKKKKNELYCMPRKKKKKIVLFLSYSYGYICELATQTPKKGILKRHYLTNLRFKILFGDPLS